MKVNYIDLGLCHGGELAWMVNDILPSLGVEFMAYGFEACKGHHAHCVKSFSGKDNVRVIHKAIGASEGTVKLYHASTPLGHSIYDSKGNIDKSKYEEVQCVRLSTFLREERIDPEDFNILRYNIEGAEWDMINDLAESGMLGFFNLFCGSDVGKDMGKVAELRDKVDHHKQILADNGIKVHYFCDEQPRSKEVVRGLIRKSIGE